MSPKLHLEPAFLCIALHKNKKCKKVKINVLHFFAPIYFAFRRRERDSNLTLNRIYYQHFKEATNSRLTNCSLDFIALLSDANPYLKLQKNANQICSKIASELDASVIEHQSFT
jgi:hypothetical protein